MYNKKVLIESLKKLGSAKAPTQKKDVVVGLNNPIQMSSMKQGGSSVDKQLSVKKSNIQGNGLFINEPIRKGDIIGLAHINNQATPIVGKNHNHSENNPTAVNISQGNKRYLVAAKDLPAGTEITTNYRLQPELEQPEDFMRNGGMTPQKDGYRTYSPYKNLPYIDIDTDTIDTDNIVYDLQLVANNGVTKNVQKNTGLHKIPGASVIREIPIDLEKQSFKKGGGPGDKWLASLVKQATRSNNLLTYPVKLAGERIARLNAFPSRSKQDIIDSLFKKDYEATYFGNAKGTNAGKEKYGFGKRDLIANYFRGIDTGFEPTNYDFDSDAGLEALINEYGPLKAYLMNSQVQHEEPLHARDLLYHRFDKSMPHSEYDYPNMLIRDPNISDNWNYSFHNYDADKTKENFHKLFDLYGKEIIPFDIQPNTSKKPPLFSFDYSPVNPIDNVAGHMAFLQRTPKNEFQLTTRDSWGFFPENYDPKWHMSDKFKQRQTQLMDAFGKPFILTQNNPITFKKGGVHKTKNKNSRSYSRSLDATNKFFAENYLFEKPSSRKNKIYDPHAKYYQKGGASSPEAWGQEIKDLESQIGNPDSWTLEDYYLLQDKLNDYRNWRETTPEGQAVNDSHNEEGEYNIPLPEHLRNYTNAVMKSKLAYANEFGNPAAKRMINLPDNPYQFDNGDTGTHYMASMDNYAVPQIQDENGQLMLGDYGPESDEAIRFDSDEDANYFAEHYKDVAPGFINAKLSPEEIQEYAKGGYIIEDISVPELDKAQKGKTVKPYYTSDRKDYYYHVKMKADSADLYNQGIQDKNTYINYLNKNGFDAKNHLERWNTKGWVDTDVHPTIGATYNGILENSGGGFNRDNRGVAHGFTTYPLKNGSFKYVYDESPEGKLLGKRYSVYKKPVQEVIFRANNNTIKKTLTPANKKKTITNVNAVLKDEVIPQDKEYKITNSDVVPKGYERVGRIFNAKLDPKTGKITEKEEFIYSPLPTRLNSISFPEVTRPEQEIIPAAPYVKPVHYAGPRHGAWSDGSTGQFPEGLNTSDWERKTLEYQQKQRSNKPVVIRRQGGELNRAQKGGEQTVTDTDKDYLIRMANSPLFKERYARMVGKPIDQVGEEAEAYRQQILNNIETVKINDVGVLPEDQISFEELKAKGFYSPPLSKESELFKPYYDSVNNTSLNKKEKKYYSEQFDEILNDFNKDKHSVYLNTDNPWTRTHELSHASVKGAVDKIFANPIKFRPYETPPKDQFNKLIEDIMVTNKPYLENPDEQKARVDVARKYLESKGLYDPVNENFTEEHLKKLQESMNFRDSDIAPQLIDLMLPYETKDKLRLFNDFVEKEPNQNSNLVKAQTGLQVAGKNIIKNIVNYNEGDLLRLLAYKGINPASYHIKEKITQMPGELYKNTINNSDRAFRTGMALRYGPRNELLDQLLTQLNTSKASWNKLSTKDKMGAVNAYDPLLMKTLEDIGQRRLDAWAVGLGQQQEYNTLEQTGEDTYKMLGIEHTPDFFSERNNDIIFHGLKDQKYEDKRDQLIDLSKQHYDLSKHLLTKRETKYHAPWQQTYHVQSSPKSDFIHSIYDNDTYGVRGGYRWDMKDTPEGMHWQANDVWDLHPWEKRSSGIINQSAAAKYYLGKTFFKPLQNVEALGLIGGKPFNIENNFLVDPKTFKTIKQWEDGGEMEYELGDEIDEATKKKLEKLGYTFEII